MTKTGAPDSPQLAARRRSCGTDADCRGPGSRCARSTPAAAMAATHGTGTVVIRRSHHIACLAAYLIRAAERGLVAIIESSDPLVAAVVPHGGLTPIITPNPIAAGLPTSGDPILVDVSMSITSMGFANQEMQRGPHAARAVAHRRRGQCNRRSRAAVQRTEGRVAAARRPRRRLQGIRPRRSSSRR